MLPCEPAALKRAIVLKVVVPAVGGLAAAAGKFLKKEKFYGKQRVAFSNFKSIHLSCELQVLLPVPRAEQRPPHPGGARVWPLPSSVFVGGSPRGRPRPQQLEAVVEPGAHLGGVVAVVAVKKQTHKVEVNLGRQIGSWVCVCKQWED